MHCICLVHFHDRKTGLYIVPARKPEAGNFCFGLVTSQTCKPGWQNFECYYCDLIARLVNLHLDSRLIDQKKKKKKKKKN